MGLFGKKKKVNCISCKTELDLNEARVVSGQYFCPACDIRRKAAAAKATQEKAVPAASSAEYPAITSIKKAFDERNIHYTVENDSERQELIAGIGGKHNSYRVKFICTGNRNDVAIRVFALAHFPEGREQAAYRLLNNLKRQYRYVKFTLDSDNDLNLEYDLLAGIAPESVGPVCTEMFVRIMKMVDDFYPEIMKAIWA